MSYSRRLVVATVALLTTLSIGALAKSPQAQSGSAAEQAVLKADNERFTAMLKADAAALEKLLADELSYTHSNAQVQDKAAFISDIKTGKIKYLTIEPTDQKARVFGTTAVVTGGASVHVVQNGNDLTFKIRYTNTHLNRGGAWQMVAWQATRLPA
jgi:hypothetical protein